MVMPRHIIHSETLSPELLCPVFGPFNTVRKEGQDEAENCCIHAFFVVFFSFNGMNTPGRFPQQKVLKKKKQ